MSEADFKPMYMDIVDAFDKDPVAIQFLREDGEGGFRAGIYRMAREIERLRAKCGEPAERDPAWQDEEDALIDATDPRTATEPKTASPPPVARCFMDGIDWQHHLTGDPTGTLLFPDEDSLREVKTCLTGGCGVVEVEVRLVRWVEEQNLG